MSICRELIRFDTTNTGDGRSAGERDAAEYVMGLLAEVGYEPVYVESAPRRGSIVLRIPGADPARPALVAHGHLDVVPAAPEDWSVDPFAAEIRDGMLWGRGAVDMKDMDAMLIAVVRDWARRGVTPPRDIVLAFFADEEAGGRLGSHWVVDHHPEFFEGATEAVSEVGGFSADIAGTRAYLVQTAEKGIAWMDLLARGTAGHGSAINEDNAVAHLVEALHAIGTHVWPQRLTPTMKALVDGVADLVGITPDYEDLEPIMAALGPVRRFVGASAATSCNLTAVSGGDKVNVVPGRARAMVDIRPLPGDGEAVWATARELAGPHVEVGVINDDVAVESPHDAPLVGAMRAALGRADPDATVLPYLLSAGTDAKALSKLGIAGYGFVPLKLPAGFDFTAMFHGADERVPLDSLDFGVGVLADFLANC